MSGWKFTVLLDCRNSPFLKDFFLISMWWLWCGLFFFLDSGTHIPESVLCGPKVWVNPGCPKLLQGKLNMQGSNLGIVFGNPRRRCTPPSGTAVMWTTLLLLATWIYANRMATIVSELFFYFDLGSYFARSANIFSFHRSQLIGSENKFRVWLSVFLLLLMEVQVLRRLFETLYVFKYNSSTRMHIFGYLTGLL